MVKKCKFVLVTSILGMLVACTSTPVAVVDSSNGTKISRGESSAQQISNGYLIPILGAVVLGGWLFKCADSGNCK